MSFARSGRARALWRAVVAPSVPDELRLRTLPRRAVPIVVMLAAVVAGLMVLSPANAGPGSVLPWWMFGFVVLSVIAADVTSAPTGNREEQFQITYASVIVMSLSIAYGPDLRLMLAAALGRSLACLHLRELCGGTWGTVGNASLIVLEVYTSGATFWALHGHVPWLVATTLGVTASWMLNALALGSVVGMSNWAGGSHLRSVVRGVRSTQAEEWTNEVFLIAFVTVAAAGVSVQPTTVVGLIAPLIMTAHANLQRSRRVSAERRLLIDPLTGIPNRTEFWRTIEGALARHAVTGDEVGVMMLDIDFFKRLNDTHGHVEGDRALTAVAKALADSVREHDLAARYGGEEFGLVVSGVPLATVLDIAERARTACRFALAPWDTSVSIGVAYRSSEWMPATLSPRQFVAIADAALYRAKHAGKNRVEPPRPEDLAAMDEAA